MSEISAPSLLLYFNDPECDDCRRVKRQLAESPVLNRRLEDGRLRLLSVDVTGESETAATFLADGLDADRAAVYAALVRAST